MNPILQLILRAYQPLRQRGLLMDGQYRWPVAYVSNDSQVSAPAARPRRGILLAALTGLYHGNFFKRSVNLACLDDVEPQELIDAPRHYADGRNNNWQSAPAETRHL